MSKITVEALKKGLESLGLEASSKKQKDLEKQVDEALKSMELGFECPSCSKDIPDVVACPYCGESFEDEDAVTDAENEDADEDADVENEAGDEDGEEEMSANEFLNKEIDETSKKVAEKLTDKPAKAEKAKDKPAKEEKVKEEKAKAAKAGKSKDKPAKEEKEESDKKGRQKIPTEVIEKRKEEFEELIAKVDAIIGDKVEKRERKTGITYVNGTERLFKLVSSNKQVVVEFNVELKKDVDGLVRYSEEEAKAKHFGSVKSIYSGESVEDVLKLIKEIKIA